MDPYENPDSNDYESKQALYSHHDEEPEESYIYSWDRDKNRDAEWFSANLPNYDAENDSYFDDLEEEDEDDS